MTNEDVKMNGQIVREIAASAFTDAIEIMAIIVTLEAANQKPAITKSLNDADAGRAAEHIKRALFTRLHFLVSRAYAKSREGDLHSRRAFDLLKDAAVRADVVTAGSDSALAEADTRWGKCIGDHRLPAFLHFRDKYLAHLGEPKDGIPIPTYGEVFGLAEDTARAMEKLAQGAGVVSLSLDSQIPAHEKSAEAFWNKWA
jgi:hypothetical protein